MTSPSLESQLHHLLVVGFLKNGRPPTSADLATATGLPLAQVEAGLRALHDSHGLVLHPHRCEPWIVHPFTTSPTHTWVAARDRGWWAPCLWCGLGISALVAEEIAIHTRLGAEAEPLVLRARAGVPEAADLWVHFPEPPRVAWGNVHHFCARLVAFRRPDDARAWAARHGFAPGEVLPLGQLADLARRWYGRHADANWTKWTIRQAREIFAACGLTGEFWSLPGDDGKF